MNEPEAWAAFHAAEDANQPFADRALAQKLVDKLVFTVSTLEVVVLSTGLLGHALGEIDQNLGLFLGKGHEVTPPDLEDVIDEAFEGWPVGEGQVAFELYFPRFCSLTP